MMPMDCLLLATDVASDAGLVHQFRVWAKAESTFGLLVVIFGLVAQLIFFSRWVVQWLSSERKGVSHVPLMFWWLSLIGASMLLVYYIIRADPVGIIGQATGWTVYLRNLHLIRREKRSASHNAASSIADE